MDEIEDLLKRYSPAGPPDSMRARIRSAHEAGTARSPWLYVCPPATIAAATLVLAVLSAGVRTELAAAVHVEDPVQDALVDDLAVVLGGDPTIREEARWIVETQERELRSADSVTSEVKPGA